jgi:DHA2 family multidrug resistance protein
LFIRRELKVDNPAVDLRVLRYPSMIGGSLYSMVLGMGLYGVMFAIPVFVQDYLHYTAMQSGLLQVPGALSAAVAMVVFGKIANRVPPRALMVGGALLTTLTGVLLMQLNPNTGVKDIFWPLIFRSVGSVMIFMPLSLATLGPLPKKDIAAGSGFYSLTRQLGSSIGIALITTMLVRREAAHRAGLVEKITEYHQPALDRITALSANFTATGGDPVTGHHRALELIDRIVNGQAALMSYADIFFYVSVAFVISLPLLLLLGGKPSKGAAEAAAAAH